MTLITDNNLQFTTTCVTMETYLTYVKGGHCDHNGRFSDSRGGSTKAAHASRHRSTVVKERRNTWTQDWWTVARRSKRANAASGKTEGTQGSEQRNRITVSSVAELAPTLSHGLSANP